MPPRTLRIALLPADTLGLAYEPFMRELLKRWTPAADVRTFPIADAGLLCGAPLLSRGVSDSTRHANAAFVLAPEKRSRGRAVLIELRRRCEFTDCVVDERGLRRWRTPSGERTIYLIDRLPMLSWSTSA